MSTVQFEPKVTADFQIDWRRPSSQGADPFADLLKRHAETDQRDRAPKKREEAADPVSGRPPRVVIAHERTLRGEAKRIEDSDRCLPRPADQTNAERCATEQEPTVPEDSAAADTDRPEQEATAEAPTENDATAEQPAETTEGEVVEPVAPVIVSVQSTAEATTDGEVVLAAVAQGERTVAAHVHIPDLDVGLPFAQVVLPRQRLAHPPVARLVVDGGHLQLQFCPRSWGRASPDRRTGPGCR